jgi:outer membrane protein assembly factor BamB
MLSRTCLLAALAVVVVPGFVPVAASPYVPHCCPRLGCDNGNTNANSALKGPIHAPSGTVFVTKISIGSDTSSELVFGPNGDFYVSTEKSLLKFDGVHGEQQFNLIKPVRSASSFQPSTVQDAPILLVSQPLIAALNSEVRGLDTDTGETLWTFDGTAFTGCGTSKNVLTTILGVLTDGTVVVSAVCSRKNAYSPAFVVQLDAADGSVLYSFAKSDEAGYLAFAATLYEHNDGENFTVFYVDLEREVALDGRTGDVLWKGPGGCDIPQAAQLLPLARASGPLHDAPTIDGHALCVLNSWQTIVPLGPGAGKAAWSTYPTYELKMAASRHGFAAVVGPSSLSVVNSTNGKTLADVTRPGDGGKTVPAVDDATLSVYDATFDGAFSDTGEMTVCVQRYAISDAPNSTLKLTPSWGPDGVCQKIKGPPPQFQQYSMQMWVAVAPSEGIYVKARTWRVGSGSYTNHVILFR